MKGIKKVVFPIMIGLVMLLGIQCTAHASPIEVVLSLDSTFGNAGDIIVLDGGPGDAAPGDNGAVLLTGSIGTWTFNITTGLTYPQAGSTPATPYLDLMSLNTTSSAPGRLYVGVSAYGYTLAPGGATFAIGGTEQNMVIAKAYSGANGAYFDLSNQLGNTMTFTGTGSFAGTTFGSVPSAPNPYSLSVVTEIVHTGPGATSFDASVAVPEPFTLIFLGSCLLGAGIVSRKFKI